MALIAGTLVGIHAAAVITVNNYRDLDGDEQSGKNPLAVRLGRPATRHVYTAEMLAPYALLPLLAELGWPAALPLLSLPLALALGSEGQGLSAEVERAATRRARIPVAREVESLNVGVAAGIAMFEISRRAGILTR